MNRAEFEADALHKGYEIREGKIEPNVHREPHVHDWDARLIVLEGALTLVRGNGHETFRVGDSCSLAANTPHEEHTEADGVRFVAARRAVAQGATR
jgi:quercetin dioxygenase-like cupin family protein